MFICFANRDDWVKKEIFHLWWEEGGPSNSKERMGESSPAVSMVDVEHHDGHILVLIVKLPRLVVELSLHLRLGSVHPSGHRVKRSHGCCVKCFSIHVESRPWMMESDLNLDDAVKGLISDKCLVTDVKLEQGCRMRPIQDCFIRARPKT